MSRTRLWTALPLFLFLPLPAHSQEAERRAMLDKYGPSVVCVRNDEGYGSGMVLDERGLVLTNAHVIVSPIPLRVEAMVREDDRIRPAVFTSVVLIGVHPTRDLALVRVDPSQHPGKLLPIVMAKERAVTGDAVYAIGYPSTRGGRTKVCTMGAVTGVDQFVDMPGYFEFSAEVHHGNSGGPVVNKKGEAIGVVTRGKFKGEPTAWAIPLHDFRPDAFIPLEQRPKDPAKASKILRYAEEILRVSKGEGSRIGLLLAQDLFSLALVEDISNADTYFKIGMLRRHEQEHSSAAAYLMRSIQIQPWNDSKDIVYHELGVCLYELGKRSEAMAVWNEAVAKFPGDSAKVWDALAVAYYDSSQYLDAACATRASLRSFGDRAAKMNEIYDKARQKLDGDEISRLNQFERSIEGQFQESSRTADKARQQGKRFLLPACEAVIRSSHGIQQEAMDFNFSSLTKPLAPSKPADIPDKELLPLFIKSRIAVASEHLQAGKFKLAVEVLEDVIKQYPDRPETESARDLLKLLNKKK